MSSCTDHACTADSQCRNFEVGGIVTVARGTQQRRCCLRENYRGFSWTGLGTCPPRCLIRCWASEYPNRALDESRKLAYPWSLTMDWENLDNVMTNTDANARRKCEGR